jgi:hypothetical protein
MLGKEKQMKSTSGALNKHWCSMTDRYFQNDLNK